MASLPFALRAAFVRSSSVASAAMLVGLLSCVGFAACSAPAPASLLTVDAGPHVAAPDARVPDSAPPLDVPPYDGGPIAAAMNDVSILFPLPTTVGGIDDLLAASAAGPRGALLPASVYAAAVPIAGSTPPPGGGIDAENVANYDDLRVVAMRVDPCFASTTPDLHGTGCTAQLRLIVQEVRQQPGSGGPQAFDSALHLFYALTRQEVLDLTQALVALRVANAAGVTLGALAPHPILVKQGTAGAFGTGLKALILNYAGVGNLTRVAQLDLEQGGFLSSWRMLAFDVADAGPTATPFPIPTLADGNGAAVFDQTVAAQLVSEVNDSGFTASAGPLTTSTDDFSPLDLAARSSLAAAQVQSAFDGLVRIENPGDITALTVDCASCHLASLTATLVAKPLFGLDDTTSPLAFAPDGQSVTAADMAQTFGTSVSTGINIHAFSYVGTSPTISQRVVNETAAIVEYVNALP